ncbi:MAG: hypothetical protein Q9183_000254 [Haloplaca sp. 2 TL-2023]
MSKNLNGSVVAPYSLSYKDEKTNGSYFPAQDRRSERKITERKGKRKNDGLFGQLCQWIARHQIGLAVNLLSLLTLVHWVFSDMRHQTRKFYRLSYYNPASGEYALGWDDSFLVVFWIVVFTGLRAAVMDYALAPLTSLVGLEKKKEKIRFAEQAWVLMYDTVFWSLGMYIMHNSDHWLNTRHLWTNWPSREMDGLFKWYYLAQFAFWLQQILIVNIEERRKDHWQMFTHHIITCALMFASYGYHQTKVGNTILCLMDVVDLLLPLAKMLKYLHFETACNIAFGAFMLVWFIARHVLYMKVCYSVYAELPKEITYGCYAGSNANLKGPMDVPGDVSHLIQPFTDPQGLVCWDNSIKWAFLIALLALQVILLIWFGMIIRVALKVLKGGEAEDSRSDDEGSDGEEMDDEGEDCFQQLHSCKTYMDGHPIEVAPLEEEVDADSINLSTRKTTTNRKYKKPGSTASGVHLPSDRKELLGRIGCDKGA